LLLKTASGVPAAVVNLEGRLFMSALDDPFRVMDELLAGPLKGVPAVCVDFHAEATSEKQALAWHLDGRASAVVGTHTHVQTADQRILPGGTAYITDLGLTGPHDSVIGMEVQTAITRIASQRPLRFKVAKGNLRLQGALVRIDEKTGRAAKITRVDEETA
jgi:metallophosphoesterase (TIGR00282 family)